MTVCGDFVRFPFRLLEKGKRLRRKKFSAINLVGPGDEQADELEQSAVYNQSGRRRFRMNCSGTFGIVRVRGQGEVALLCRHTTNDRVVLDTNVLVAAFRSSSGASHRLLQTLEGRTWRPVVSPALALEYEAVLKREAAGTNVGAADIDDFVELLLQPFQTGADLLQMEAGLAGSE